MPEVLLHVYCEAQHYRFVSGTQDSSSVFGGPQERRLNGQAHGPARLHQVAELRGRDIPVLTQHYVFGLPLLYGFRFDGCSLKYRFATNDIDVLELTPSTSSDDWPYLGYPSLLPYVPLQPEHPRASSWEAFAKQFPNMASSQPAQLVAVVEPPFSLGFSTWGKGGDLEGVCVVFECDLVQKTVASYNVCG